MISRRFPSCPFTTSLQDCFPVSRIRTITLPTFGSGYADPLPGYEFLGRQYWYGSSTEYQMGTGYDTCIDTVGLKDEDNPLTIEHERYILGEHNGINGVFTDVGWAVPFSAGSHVLGATVDPPDVNLQMTDTLAATAPFASKWSAANAFYELKDFRHLPRTIRDVGDAVLSGKAGRGRRIKTGADGYLTWEFGIAPLISDVKSLLKFVDRTKLRIQELRGERRPGGLRRKQTTYRDTNAASAGPFYVAGYYRANQTFMVDITTKREYWGSCRWSIPSSHLPPVGSQDEYRLAARLANGLDISPNTIWQAMPWTWLEDWFSNFDDFIKLSYNIVGAQSGRYNVMEHTITHCKGRDCPGLSNADGGSVYETKTRTPWAFVFPEAHLPFMTGGMVTIISALGIQRAR